MSISGARNAAFVVSFTFNEVMAAINLDHSIAGSASRSSRSHIETQGAECAFVASPETPKKDAKSDVGIFAIGCAGNEWCIKDESSSLGGRCSIFHAEEGVAKAHRDLSSSGPCDANSDISCMNCTMLDGTTAGRKCDGKSACNNVNTTNVSCGSCNGVLACENAAGTIGESSCNGIRACGGLKAAGTIGGSSCNGKDACGLLKAAATIGENSCNAQAACDDQQCELNFYLSIKFTTLAQDIHSLFDIQMRSGAIVGKSSIKYVIVMYDVLCSKVQFIVF
jgi:hypothetical protein